jgi:hypothetical protein
MRTTIIAILLFTTVAEASTLRRSRGELEVTDTGHATLTVVLKSSSIDGAEVVQEIDLPHGMTATGMSMAMGNELAVSVVVSPTFGRATYDEIVREIKDPALLEYRGDGRAVLRVFPVRRDTPATVVIELTATSLVSAADLRHLGKMTSLLAVPGVRVRAERADDLYADYWPAH